MVTVPKSEPTDATSASTSTPETAGTWTVEEAIAKAGFDAKPTTISFFHLAGRLKKTQRQGWKRFGIQPESVADHSHRMTIMALDAPPQVNQAKCIKLCLVHDVAEALVGDITPMDGVPREEKARREDAVMLYLQEQWGDVGRDVRYLWGEFEAGTTPEAEFAQDIDKVEMMLQAVEYERDAALAIDLGEFFGVAARVRTGRAQAWTADILREREELWGDKEHVRGELGVAGGWKPEQKKLVDEYYQ